MKIQHLVIALVSILLAVNAYCQSSGVSVIDESTTTDCLMWDMRPDPDDPGGVTYTDEGEEVIISPRQILTCVWKIEYHYQTVERYVYGLNPSCTYSIDGQTISGTSYYSSYSTVCLEYEGTPGPPSYSVISCPEDATISVSGPSTVFVGETATYSASVSGSGGGYIYWFGGSSSGGGSSYSTSWSQPGNYTVTAALSSGAASSINVVVIKPTVSLQSVTNADLIGSDIYATSTDAGNIVVQLAVSPSNAPVSVSWSGGSSGSNQLQRLIPRSSVNESGVAVQAICGSDVVFTGTFYVFPAYEGGTVTINRTVTRNDSLLAANLPLGADPADAYGVTGFHVVGGAPVTEYIAYYENKTWKFKLKSVSYIVDWAVQNTYKADVVSATMSPFPLGYQMDPGSSEIVRKTRASTDLFPSSAGIPPRTSYWSKSITEQHENFHISDFVSYYQTSINEAATSVGSISVPVTLSNLSSSGAKTSQQSAVSTIIDNKGLEALQNFSGASEDRAYSDGKAAYQALSAAISEL